MKRANSGTSQPSTTTIPNTSFRGTRRPYPRTASSTGTSSTSCSMASRTSLRLEKNFKSAASPATTASPMTSVCGALPSHFWIASRETSPGFDLSATGKQRQRAAHHEVLRFHGSYYTKMAGGNCRHSRLVGRSIFNSIPNMLIGLESCELCASHEHAPVFRITDGDKKSSACATRRFPRYRNPLLG